MVNITQRLLFLFISLPSWCSGFVVTSPRRIGARRVLRVFSAPHRSSASLEAIWERALCLQRAGDSAKAIEEYELLVAAAEASGAPPASLSEAHINMGQLKARLGDRQGARDHIHTALETRSLATAHINLALLELADGEEAGCMSTDALNAAIKHCKRALSAEESNEESLEMARKILADAQRALGKGV